MSVGFFSLIVVCPRSDNLKNMANTMIEIDNLMKHAKSVLHGKNDGAIAAMCEKVIELLALVGLVIYNVVIKPR